MTTTSLATPKTELPEIPLVNKTKAVEETTDDVSKGADLFVPVWYIGLDFYASDHVGTTNGPAIRYVYEWKPGISKTGVETERYANPYVTLTDRFGPKPTTTPSPLEPSVTTPPKVDLTVVPEWYSWFS